MGPMKKTATKNLILALLMASLFNFSVSAFAEEEKSAASNGSNSPVYFSRFFLQPEAQLDEPSIGTWGPLLWAAGLKTRFSSWVDIQASFGSPSLLYRPYWSPPDTDPLTFIE